MLVMRGVNDFKTAVVLECCILFCIGRGHFVITLVKLSDSLIVNRECFSHYIHMLYVCKNNYLSVMIECFPDILLVM